MSKFEPGKTYRTRDGREALIYCTDAPGEYPIHGRVAGDPDPNSWTASGRYASDAHGSSLRDLLPPVPPRIREKRWCNVWPGGRAFEYETADAARKIVDRSCIRIAVPCELVEIVEDAA
ncbi:MAG: hypothetical protein ACYC3L_00700 [Gemmatimonadaceae bacterium]